MCAQVKGRHFALNASLSKDAQRELKFHCGVSAGTGGDNPISDPFPSSSMRLC